MSFQLITQMLIDNSQYQRTLQKSARQMEGFGKQMKTVSNGIKAAWAGVAALGIGAVFDAIKDVTKAASEDAKSTALMNNALSKNWHLTDKVKTSVNAYIDSMSAMSGIVDDELKPAYATVARQTKSQDKANKMLTLSMNIAADKHISVAGAAKLVAKAMAGNQKAFDKLYPSAKKSGDAIGYVNSMTAGAAQQAGENDPFARMSATMDIFKEKLGTAFLPIVQKFADWLSSGESQKALDDIAKKVQKFGEWFTSPAGQKAFQGWMKDLKTMIKLAGDFMGLVGNVAALLDTGAKTGNNATSTFQNVVNSPRTNFNNPRSVQQALSGGTNTGNFSTAGAKITNTFYLTATQTSGREVINALTSYARGKGVPMSKLLG